MQQRRTNVFPHILISSKKNLFFLKKANFVYNFLKELFFQWKRLEIATPQKRHTQKTKILEHFVHRHAHKPPNTALPIFLWIECFTSPAHLSIQFVLLIFILPNGT